MLSPGFGFVVARNAGTAMSPGLRCKGANGCLGESGVPGIAGSCSDRYTTLCLAAQPVIVSEHRDGHCAETDLYATPPTTYCYTSTACTTTYKAMVVPPGE